jgi:outer membrane protein assembly factor BamA
VVVLDGQVRVAPNLFAGAHYRMINLDTTLNLEDVPQFQTLGIPNPHLSATTSAIGPVVVYDSRDNEFAPRRGEFATIQYLQSSSALGSDFEYGKLVAEANIYRPLDENSVIAARVSMCSTGEDAPFFDICLFGSSNDLRGYPSGQYRDLGMFATQVEYRRRLGGRFGAVVFAGVGGVSDKFTNFDNYRILPAGGVGLRYSTSKDYGVNISVDFAWGKDSSGLYLYVAEAF